MIVHREEVIALTNGRKSFNSRLGKEKPVGPSWRLFFETFSDEAWAILRLEDTLTRDIPKTSTVVLSLMNLRRKPKPVKFAAGNLEPPTRRIQGRPHQVIQFAKQPCESSDEILIFENQQSYRDSSQMLGSPLGL